MYGTIGGALLMAVDDARLRLASQRTADTTPRLESQCGRMPARILYVYDGDTVCVLCILNGRLCRRRCRLNGINAPGLTGSGVLRTRAEAAREFLNGLLSNNTTVILYYDGFDKYGRLLVRFRVAGRWVADQMVIHGHACRMGHGRRQLVRDSAVFAHGRLSPPNGSSTD